MGAVTTAILTAAAIAGTYQSNEQRVQSNRAGRTAGDQQLEQQRRQEAELTKRRQQELSSASSLALRNAQRNKNREGMLGTRSGTILTSPLGLPNQTGSGSKTLLGQ